MRMKSAKPNPREQPFLVPMILHLTGPQRARIA